MRCEDLHDLIEPFVAGDISLDSSCAEHLESCARCTASLALARRVHRSLATRHVPAPPSGFVTGVLDRVSRDRWRAERSFDLWFNVLIALSGLVVVAGLAMLLNLSGLWAVASDLSDLLGAGVVLMAGRLGPVLPVYGTATALLLLAFVLWWWTERRVV